MQKIFINITLIVFIYISNSLFVSNGHAKNPENDSSYLEKSFTAINESISLKDRSFIDAKGRQIILHGINLVNKNKTLNYLGNETPDDFKAMKEWGLNCIRLGIIWDGLEPQPGVYNEEYLKGIDKRIGWAKQNGLFVLLDMHQDLFSVKYSDGAPEWATLDEGKLHIHDSPVWSDAYFTSPAVQTAFDNFWNNAPAPDGIGIQEHYARAWQHVAKRYAQEPAVIGYDIMNEPFIGSPIVEIQPLMFQKGAAVLAQVDTANAPSFDELIHMWDDEEGRFEILQYMADENIYSQIIDSTEPYYTDFESTKLVAMYQCVTNAIRKVDKNHILFLETSISSNMGVRSGIAPVVSENGERDPLQAYAPHGYDIVTDTKAVSLASPERVELIFTRHKETSEKLNMPILVGEWGAYYRHSSVLPVARQVVKQFENLLCSDMYWDYWKGLEHSDFFKAIKRPYPEKISGNIKSYKFDSDTGVFKLVWEEDPEIKVPSQIYIPDWYLFDIDDVKITSIDKGFNIRPVMEGSKSNYILINQTGKKGLRTLTLSLKRK